MKEPNDEWYTDPKDYDEILEIAKRIYPEIEGQNIVRPFWPGADYTAVDYENKLVFDNPPFSILSQIVKFYHERDIKFVLFIPALQGSTAKYCDSYIFLPRLITFANKGELPIALYTNLSDNDIWLVGGDKGKKSGYKKRKGNVITISDFCSRAQNCHGLKHKRYLWASNYDKSYYGTYFKMEERDD